MLCVALDAYAQPSKKEKASGKESYEKFRSQSRSSNAEDLLREANSLLTTNPDQALTKVKEALGISIAQENPLNEARC